MAVSACPFCFAKVNTSALAYQCSGQGTGGKRCEKEENSAWRALTDLSVEQYPSFKPASAPGRGARVTCPECSGPALRRACPECLLAVPGTFVDSNSPMIGVVGSKGSGKTIFTTVLINQIRVDIGKRFGASVRFAVDRVGDEDSVLAYTQLRETPLFQHGVLPQGTVANGQSRRYPIVLEWQTEPQRRFGVTKNNSAALSVIDSAGEDFDTLEDAYSLQYLSSCDGLMVALDPFGLPGARAMTSTATGASSIAENTRPLDAINRVTEVLRTSHQVKRNKKIKVPLAVVFTKIDAFFPMLGQGSPIMTASATGNTYAETDGQNVHEHMKALLSRWGADDIDLHLRMNYETYRFFGTSALGAEPLYDENRVAPGGVRPHRVQDPFLWLLAKEGLVKSA